MRTFVLYSLLMLMPVSIVFAKDAGAVSYHLSFDSLEFAKEDWIEQTGWKTTTERKWELIDGQFGQALYLAATPVKFTDENMSNRDLDLVTAIIVNVGWGRIKGQGYDQPFLWGAGKIHPGCGAVAFWVKGSCRPEDTDIRTVLFEQASITWGRLERQLMEVELLRDGTITAYVEDARYVQHRIKSSPVWKNGQWNHIVFMWDRSSGLSLWVNGRQVASSMGTEAWWENQRPGLFHFPMPEAAYDEFYAFTRTLTDEEISRLYETNIPPTEICSTVSQNC